MIGVPHSFAVLLLGQKSLVAHWIGGREAQGQCEVLNEVNILDITETGNVTPRPSGIEPVAKPTELSHLLFNILREISI